MEDQSEAEDVGDLDDLLERANVELGGAITGPSRNAGKKPVRYRKWKFKINTRTSNRSKHILQIGNKDLH